MGTSRRIRIVCVSDTHNDDPTIYIPNADILLHAGDMTDNGTPEELEKALNWIRKLPQKLKIIIPGALCFFFLLAILDVDGTIL